MVEKENVNIGKDKDINPEEVVKLVMPLVKEDKPKEEDVIEFLKKLPEQQKGSTRQELIDLLLTDKIAERLSNKEDLDLNKLLAIGLIKNILQPPQPAIDTNLLAALISKTNNNSNSDGWVQIMQLYLQQQAQAFQAQQQFNQQLLTMMYGERLQKQDEQLEELRESINQQIELISKQIEALRKQQPSVSLEGEIQDWMKKKEMLENIAESLRPEKIVKEGGKIDWGNILNRILKIGETFAAKLPVQQPALRPIEAIPVQPETQSQPVQETQPVIPEQTEQTVSEIQKTSELEFR